MTRWCWVIQELIGQWRMKTHKLQKAMAWKVELAMHRPYSFDFGNMLETIGEMIGELWIPINSLQCAWKQKWCATVHANIWNHIQNFIIRSNQASSPTCFYTVHGRVFFFNFVFINVFSQIWQYSKYKRIRS